MFGFVLVMEGGGDNRNNALSSVSLKHLSGGTERQISTLSLHRHKSRNGNSIPEL